MEPRGRERHRWANREVANGREHMSQSVGSGIEFQTAPSARHNS